MSHYDTNLEKNNANHVPLTPLSFLERVKDVYPNYEAIVYEDRKYTWNEVYRRVTKFASALEKIGVGKGDTVSFLAFNTPEIFEGHYSVPMTGGVLNAINIRLDANTIAYILKHSDAKVLIFNDGIITGRQAKARHLINHNNLEEFANILRDAIFNSNKKTMYHATAYVGLHENFIVKEPRSYKSKEF